MANNKTIFQRLNSIFDASGIDLTKVNNQTKNSSNTYSLNNDILLKTPSKEEYELAKLQAQQGKFLSGLWKKSENELLQHSLHYETTRIGSYADFESMEFYPEIAAALDIFMEEATTVNAKGRVLNIYSESKRIQGVLEDLFFNRLDIHLSLPMWTRNICKYGDNFLLLNIDDKNGIVGTRQLPNFEIERKEGDVVYNQYSNEYKINNEGENAKVKFFWRGRDFEFNSWQIAHFRLLGDDRRLPYGTCLKGDTRINTEFGVEEIKNIKIGTKVWSFNIDTQEKELSPILDKVMSGTKEVFKISTRHNFIDASKEHKILIATESGEFIYKNVDDLKLGDLLVLNKNEHTNKKIKIDKTKSLENKNGWFNDIDCIPDYVTEEFAQLFGFLIGDGWISTRNNQVSFALGVDIETNDYYINLLEKFSNKTHIKTKNTQAHVNSKLLSTILDRMGFGGKSYEKRIPDWVFEMELEFQKAFVAGLMDADGWATRDQWVIALHIELNNKPLIEDLKILLQRIGYKSGSIRSRIRKKPIIEGREIKTVKESHLITFFDSYLTQMKKYEFKNRKTDNFVLEPIQTIESIGEHETYDIYVENDNHNFYANNIVVHNSLLEKARSIWKRLQLAEDAMLVYRITRAPERRIYKIFVGNLDDKDVPAYVDEIANRFKRRPVIDPQTGQIDLRYNQLANDQDYFIPVRDENAATPIDTLQGACVALDTKIPLLDGRTLELQEIIKEWDNGNRDLWVYSCNPETGELAPGMITWAGHTRKNAQVVKITLDNGKTITTTPDHKWVHRTKGFVEAKDLVVGDSLMPFYRDTKKIKSNTNGDYERLWDSNKQEWVFTHRMVTDSLNSHDLIKEFLFDEKYINEDKLVRHHKDHNRFNNNPTNLVWMNGADHMRYHQSVIMETIWGDKEENIKKISNGMLKYISNLSDEEKNIRYINSKINTKESRKKAVESFRNNPNRSEILKRRGEHISKIKSTEEAKEKMSLMSKEFWKSEEYRNKVFSKNQNLIFTDELYNMFFEMFKLTGRADLALNEVNKSEEFMFEFNKPNLDIRSSLTNLNEFTHNHLKKMLKERGFANYREWSRNTALELGYKNLRAWRYFIEKDKNKIANENYNHKIISIEWLNDTMDTGTITVDGNEIYHNYHTFATDSGVFIKNSNLDAIGDIQYLQRKLFTALRVPKTFLGFEEAVGDGKNLALQDIRFSRTINRIQQAIISELNKIAIIHLYMLGFEDELNNFNLSLNNPSTQAEMLKIEQLQAKMSVYKDAISEAGNGFMGMSMTRARREILGWSDEEIRKDLLEQRLEKAAAAEIEQTSSVIKTTGIFDEVDSIYGDMSAVGTGSPEGQDSDGGMSGGGGFGGGGGGGLPPLDTGSSSEEGGLEPVETPEGGLEPVETPEGGAPESETPEGGAPAELSERFNKRKNLIKENVVKHKKLITEKQNYVNKLLDVIDSNEKPLINERVVVYDKNLKINEHINSIIKDIDDMLKD